LIGVLGGRRLLLLAVAVSIGLSNWARFSFHPWTLITNLDGFALGGLIAYGLEFRAKHAQRVAKWPELLLMVVASALLLWPLSQTIFGGTGGDQTDPLSAHTAFMLEITRFRLLAACIVALVVCLSGKRVLAPLRHPILVYLGTISYGIYLYHVPIYHLISPNHSRLVCTDPMWVDLLKLVATLGVAALSWKFLEQPILRLKDRFPHHEGRAPSRSPGHRTDAAHPTNSSSTFGTIPAAAPRSSSVRTARRPTGP
jgi:peptidoglycan/LPS O-acetylase OafA/YrhL